MRDVQGSHCGDTLHCSPHIDGDQRAPSSLECVEPEAPMDKPVFTPVTAPPAGHAYIPPALAGGTRCSCGLVRSALALGAFHVLNAVLGAVAFAVVFAGAALSICLLPLCCFGLVVLQVTLDAVARLTELDVALSNLVAPARDLVYARVPCQDVAPHWLAFSSSRLVVRNPVSFSSEALLVAFYFLTIKCGLAVLSAIAVSIALAFPVSIVATHVAFFFASPGGIVLFVLVTAVLVALGLAVMKVTARASRVATRFFCCKELPTHEQGSQARQAQAVASYDTSQPAQEPRVCSK